MIYTAYSHAKINLGLSIQGKRLDGYHEIETVFYPVFQLYDEIEIKEVYYKNQIEIEGGQNQIGNPLDNLCLRAWQALKEVEPRLPYVHIRLVKNIPIGAGLGGGSSNAAFTLKGLIELFSISLDNHILQNIARKLGADVPFFLYDKPMFATGIGTDFEPISFLFPGILQIHPMPVFSNTALAYQGLRPQDFSSGTNIKAIIESGDIKRWRTELRNDFEPSVFQRFPELSKAKDSLYASGADYVSMSGSGSALFSIKEKKES